MNLVREVSKPSTGTAADVSGLRVSTRYGLELVAGVDITVSAGEIFGIVGETGAGKTLCTRALLGLLPPGLQAEGRMALGGREPVDLADASGLSAVRGRGITAVLQNPVRSFDPVMRVGRQVTEAAVQHGLMSRGHAVERAGRLLGELGLDPDRVMGLYPHQLSGGMSQRVAIAIALMPSPELMIIDEPTSALDAAVKLQALELIQRVAHETGIAVVLVSHDLGLVSRFCDTLAVMYAGRILEYGAAEELLRDPLHPYSAALTSSSASVRSPRRAPLAAIPGTPPRPGAWPGGCVFAPRCPRATAFGHECRPALRETDGRKVACHAAFSERGRCASPGGTREDGRSVEVVA